MSLRARNAARAAVQVLQYGALHILFQADWAKRGQARGCQWHGKIIPRNCVRAAYVGFEIHFWGEKAKTSKENSPWPSSLQGYEKGAPPLPKQAPMGCCLPRKGVTAFSSIPLRTGPFILGCPASAFGGSTLQYCWGYLPLSPLSPALLSQRAVPGSGMRGRHNSCRER